MTHLSEFIEARIAETEAVARAALKPKALTESGRVDDGRWSTGGHPMDEQEVQGIGIHVYDEGGHSLGQAQHIALHDPARVLARCTGDRAVLEAFRSVISEAVIPIGQERDAMTAFEQITRGSALGLALRARALEWADHPDYDEEWKL